MKYFYVGFGILVIGGVIALIYLQTRPKADTPTPATDTAHLVRHELPTTLPTIYESAGNGTGDFGKLLREADAADRIINGGTTLENQQAASSKLCQALVDAVEEGKFANSFGDTKISKKQFNDPAMKKGLATIRQALLMRVEQLIAAEQYDQADDISKACFELGHRLFTQNTRLRARQSGLTLMRAGLNQLRLTAEAKLERGVIDQTAYDQQISRIDPWSTAVHTIQMAWQPKLTAIDTPKPNVGDVIRVAENDEDLTFRVFATRRLGFARFEHGEPANAEAISDALSRAAQSNEKMVQEAGKAGQELTKDEFHSALR